MFLLKKKILGVPALVALIIVLLCVAGIVVGSFYDWQINVALENKTAAGELLSVFGLYFSYCLYPAAGMCIYKGLVKKGKNFKFLAWVLLIISFFLAVYYSNNYSGSKIREMFGYTADKSPVWISLLSYLFWVLLYSWVPLVFYFVLDDINPKMLIAVGATIIIAGVASDCVNLWLKQVASRPRYKYLITTQDPHAGFKNWWEFNPYFAGSNDNFKSWPSGNMTIATMIFSLPLLIGCVKKANKVATYICLGFAVIFVAIYGYNRIHMTNHFLTDVCFGTLITYVIYVITDIAFQKTLKPEN